MNLSGAVLLSRDDDTPDFVYNSAIAAMAPQLEMDAYRASQEQLLGLSDVSYPLYQGSAVPAALTYCTSEWQLGGASYWLPSKPTVDILHPARFSAPLTLKLLNAPTGVSSPSSDALEPEILETTDADPNVDADTAIAEVPSADLPSVPVPAPR